MKSRYVRGSAGDPGCQIPVTRKEPVSPPDGMEMDYSKWWTDRSRYSECERVNGVEGLIHSAQFDGGGALGAAHFDGGPSGATHFDGRFRAYLTQFDGGPGRAPRFDVLPPPAMREGHPNGPLCVRAWPCVLWPWRPC